MPKAVIFDVDGTLIDTVGPHAQDWADTFQRFGLEVAIDRIRGQIGKDGESAHARVSQRGDNGDRQSGNL